MKRTEIKRLDKLCRELVIKRDKEICQRCRKIDRLNVHHIVGRTDYALRWELDNLITLCSGHHTLNNDSFHKDPQGTMEWFKKKYPKRYIFIRKHKGKIIKHNYDTELERLKGAQ